jgi:hypothetical protein
MHGRNPRAARPYSSFRKIPWKKVASSGNYANTPNHTAAQSLSSKRLLRNWRQRLADELPRDRPGHRVYVGGLRSNGPWDTLPHILLSKALRQFLSPGVVAVNSDDVALLNENGHESFPNPTFVYSSAFDKDITLHCITEPLLGFHIAETYDKIILQHPGISFTRNEESEFLLQLSQTVKG